MQAATMSIEQLTVAMDGRQILRAVDLRILDREKVALSGPSGCGKSTLLRCLLGFVPIYSGTIRIGGELLTPTTVWRLRGRMAYVPQEPELGEGTVREVLERPFSFAGNRPLWGNLQRIPQLLEQLLLPEALLTERVTDLSGGEKQRIALLAALLLDRRILLLDEASSALDQVSKQAVIDLLSATAELTILSVSHDQEWLGVADRIVNLAELQGRMS